ncbi:putative toxin-antitoxin system toxin component, PIN family [Paracraurococcus ruber]|uniref:Toxin-antitoxin system toxin component, PIN family n=1 Tax=Paracraurococcus ruber TaxID=77675 RepID=A0ABS1D8Z4_9PROT|nr:putative toxin-antitoxin system toxin component, PIN family [Paracraurococcus ruber]MBK1662537.1 putative toxin-antitoxin system toxin component, PIN family [Paracraurococcus ruber]TDG27212.1 putative toxin-antitoxin system toxin component, PIN family [Paracraurococcus ruber]
MIVFDTSTLVGAAIGRGSVPDQAVRYAFAADRVAMSEAMMTEVLDVLARPRLARFLDPDLRDEVLSLLDAFGVFFAPAERVTDCRNAKDNKVLELALAAGAELIISSDADLLVLHPWRGVHILRPAEYLAEAKDHRP